MKPAYVIVGVIAIMVGAVACGGATPNTRNDAVQEAVDAAQAHTIYVTKNDLEFQNYNNRQILVDDPSTIIWCTTAWQFPGSPMITVPIVGKLTSGNKRPYPVNQEVIDTDTGGRVYYPELPGADGMYGTSGEYRYGFTPAGLYVDFYGMQTFCTNEPTVWQRENTVIISEGVK